MHWSAIFVGERTGQFPGTTERRASSYPVPLSPTHLAVRTPPGVLVLVSWPMALRQPIGSSPSQRRNPESPRLIAADAALTLLERWSAELTVLRRRSPSSDAVKTLADCIEELSAAITAGHDVTIQLTVLEAHSLSHIPVSTLRWLCNRRPALLGAHKREGIWYLDRSLFERYLATPDARYAQRRDAQPIGPPPDEVIALPSEPRADVGVALA